MKWEGHRKSSNVIDKRKKRVRYSIAGLVMGVAALFASVPTISPHLSTYLQSKQIQSEQFEHQEHKEFIATTLAFGEDTWKKILGRKWKDAKLVLFQDGIRTACGEQSSDIGPFYCSGDNVIYIDLNFFAALDRQYKAGGDASQSYVVFHELGHHVQNLLGTLPQTYNKMARQKTQAKKNQLLVKLELQADCYAGIVFHHIKDVLEPGDVAEFVNAAARIGDDWLQRGNPVPDSFTHGTSKQRTDWLMKGYESGNYKTCNTF